VLLIYEQAQLTTYRSLAVYLKTLLFFLLMTNWLQQGGLISSIPYEEGAKADAKKVIQAISNV